MKKVLLPWRNLLRCSLTFGTATIAIISCGSLPATTVTKPLEVAVVSGDACGAFPTVTYRAAQAEMPQQLTIMAGDRPTPGYQVIVSSATQQGSQIDINYFIQTPPPGSFLPQMMTRPCVNVMLPKQGWSRLKVINVETEQAWQFNRDVNL